MAGIEGSFDWISLIYMIVGTCIGIIVGALPGLGAALAISICLPFTFTMPPVPSILFLFAIYVGSTYGGSIAAILIHTPGTPSAAATVLDGYPLAQNGFPKKALSAALYSSVFGTFAGVITLIIFAPAIAKIAINFGPVEYTSLMFFSLSMVAISSGNEILKGLITASFGLFLATIGPDPILGTSRFAFGTTDLQGGLEVIPILIGLFAVSETLIQAEKLRRGETQDLKSSITLNKNNQDSNLSIKEFFSKWKTLLKSSVIGTGLGALPALGGAVACFVAYNEARRTSKNPEKFGTGCVEGIVSAESANNATCGSALIPLLTFGVPGDVVTAVLLGALMIQGLRPGPMLFQEHGDIIVGLFVGFLICSILLLLIASFFMPLFSKIIHIKDIYLYPGVMILSLTGSYSMNNNIFDVKVTVLFGIIGYILRKWRYPIPPLIIAFILGSIFETNLRQALNISDIGMLTLITSPIAVFFYLATIISLFKTFQMYKKNEQTTDEFYE
ncbi:MAG: tripartite tricarboxylate transporter permease [Bacillota bacterium]